MVAFKSIAAATAAAIALAGCAGRDPHPIAIAQPRSSNDKFRYIDSTRSGRDVHRIY
jgi:hypothetical protein